jgi:hypothetical protein
VASPEWKGEALAHADFGWLTAITIARNVSELGLEFKDGALLLVDETVPGGPDLAWLYEPGSGVLTQAPSLLETAGRYGLCFWNDSLFTIANNCVQVGDCCGGSCVYGGLNEYGLEDGAPGRFESLSGMWCDPRGLGGIHPEGIYFLDATTLREATSAAGGQWGQKALKTHAGDVAHPGPETTAPPSAYMRLTSPRQVGAGAGGEVLVRGNELVRVSAEGQVSSCQREVRVQGSLVSLGETTVLGPSAVYFVAGGFGVIEVPLSEICSPSAPASEGRVVTSESPLALEADGHGGLYGLMQQGEMDPCQLVHIDPSSGAVQSVLELPPHGHPDVFRGCGVVGFTAGAGESLFVARRSANYKDVELSIFDAAIGTQRLLAPPVDGWHIIPYPVGGELRSLPLAYDAAGVLYVADRQRVRALVVDTGEVFDVVGKPGSAGVQLGALPASLNNPVDIALLPDGSLAIADFTENVVVVAK